MANVINGTYTLKQILRLQYQGSNPFKNRFDNVKRDKVKLLRVRSIKYFDKDRPKAPLVLYEIVTYSKPNYGNYLRDYKKGTKKKSQRKIMHDYDCVLQMDSLSLNTTAWRGRVGRMARWREAPQSMIKTIKRDTKNKWKKEASRKFKTIKEQKEYVKKKERKQRLSGRYLDEGDYNAQVNGINGDFIFRHAFTWNYYGHLYKRGGYYVNRPSSLNKDNIMAFPKHFIALVTTLMENGVLKDV